MVSTGHGALDAEGSITVDVKNASPKPRGGYGSFIPKKDTWHDMISFLPICQSIYLSIYLTIYLYIYISLSLYLSIYLCLPRSIYIYMYIYIYISISICNYIYIYIYVYLYLCLCICICICISVCICICMSNFMFYLIQETARVKPRYHPPNRKTIIKVADANSTTKVALIWHKLEISPKSCHINHIPTRTAALAYHSCSILTPRSKKGPVTCPRRQRNRPLE